jgi:hypothetical protein
MPYGTSKIYKEAYTKRMPPRLGPGRGCVAPVLGLVSKPAGTKMNMEEMYRFKVFALDHWLEILVVGIVLIFVLMQVTRQR